ncbi:MAG: hypothetical protein K5696_11730 [Lachnospiraceae bacterium]|nr:hypothetical protein [Lachnospiraceae bacterium]
MKNQYVGDIGDYGKYSLLRAFSDAGIRLGVNWYLTDDDGSTDGKFKDYLKKDTFRKYDPVVYDALKKIDESGNRTVEAIQNSDILPGAKFFADSLSIKGAPSERAEKRYKWLLDSIWALSGTDLVFLDPDNGLLVKDDPSTRGAEKYALPREVMEYWNSSHNVVYYCHRGRRTDEQWQEYMRAMRKTMPGTRIIVLTYHKGTQRSYVFLVRKMHFDKYRKILDGVLKNWNGVFTDEGIEHDDESSPFILADREFVIYNEQNVTLNASIRNGCLHLESSVYGEEYDSEKYYDFTSEDTKKLLSIMTLENFIASCREGHLIWMEQFLKDNGIRPKTFCY